jgi:DNA-binding NarL/FixJ family response regulator
MSFAPSSVKVAAIDDEHVVRMMIERFLGNAETVEVVGTFHDIDQMVLSMQQSPDVVLLDWNLPGSRVYGLEGISTLKSRFPAARIIIFSALGDDETAINAIRHGADGYLLKNTSPQTLVAAVGSVASGHNAVSPSILNKMFRYMRNGETNTSAAQAANAPETTGLTAKERAVMDLICKRESTKRIAEHMGVTIHTVRFHLRNIYEKLGAHTQTEAVLNYLKIAKRD